MNHNLYANFDAITCINLIDRQDRYTKMVQLFDRLAIPCKFYRSNRHPSGGRVGCFDSHIQVIKQAYEQGANLILVFEDDIVPTVPREYLEDIISKCLPLMKTTSYFQLGYQVMPHQVAGFLSAPTPIRHAAKFAGNCTHAYTMNRTGMERVLSTYSRFMASFQIDLYYIEVFRNDVGCCLPLVFDQNFCSDNDNEAPTSSYYQGLRLISCRAHRQNVMYWFTIIKKGLFTCICMVILFILIGIILSCQYFRKNK